MAPLGIKLTLFKPSGTILKVGQKSPIDIFLMKFCILFTAFNGQKVLRAKKKNSLQNKGEVSSSSSPFIYIYIFSNSLQAMDETCF